MTFSQKNYAIADFWDDRFSYMQKSHFDWYALYDELSEILHHITGNPPVDSDRPQKCLVIGCGNSTFSHDLAVNERLTDILNIDISSAVIEQMKQRYPSQKWMVADVTRMSEYSDLRQNYDLIFDKGTMDALLCDSSSQAKAALMLNQAADVLSSGGKFLLVTHKPDRIDFIQTRSPLIVSQIWKCDLSDQSLLINIMHNAKDESSECTSLKEKALNPKILQEVMSEYKTVIGKKRSRRALRGFMKKRGNLDASQRSLLIYDSTRDPSLNIFGEIDCGSRRSDFCFVYVLVKR